MLNLQKYAFTLVRNKPELKFTIPFRGYYKQAQDTFNKLSFCLNASPFDRLYFYAISPDESKTQLFTFVDLKGVFEDEKAK
jgi:hypothetical protein